MADENHEPDYVNDLPDDCPENTPRCQHVFDHGFLHKGKSVRDRPCGLPVPDDDIGRNEGLCYFHSEAADRLLARQDDKELKHKLEGAAVFRKGYLGQARLPWASLEGVCLRSAKLQNADLMQANLQRADLTRAKLQGAVLFGAKLQGAKLSEANLQGADLSYADLRGADLSFVGLQGADLSHAKLQGANLSYTQLHGTYLRRAVLFNGDLRQVTIASLQEGAEEIGLAITRMADVRQADLRGALLSGGDDFSTSKTRRG